MGDFNALVGAQIRALRKGLKMKQGDLCLAVGVSRETISNYERGRTEMTFSVISRIAGVLNAPLSSLIPAPTPVTDSDALTVCERSAVYRTSDWAAYIQDINNAAPGFTKTLLALYDAGFFADAERVKILVDFMRLLEKSR